MRLARSYVSNVLVKILRMKIAKLLLLLAIGTISLACTVARADSGAAGPAAPSEESEGAPYWIPQLLAAQYTGIRQHLYPFGAAYSGPLSLTPDGDTQTSNTFGAYFGMQMTAHWQAYLDIEMFKGGGVGNATGLGGPVNGDVVREGSGLPKTPYVARAYVQYTLPLVSATTQVSRAQDQLSGEQPASALVFKLGKLAVSDDFDQNRYANNARTEFLNWTLVNDGAWDYAADTRGYTDGAMLAWEQPAWALKFGVYRMPKRANQEALEWPLTLAHGENLELDLMPNQGGMVIRLLAYRNVARMGIYTEAIANAQQTGTTPDIVADDAEGRVKHGFAVNLEQPLADNGDTGLFLRAGWNDGRTESFVFTEVDRNLSFGAQLSGVHWGKPEDQLGVGVSINALSSEHKQYLELGGCGFELCDGALNYGYEKILEAYYRFQFGRYVQLSPDVQFVSNPGYNRDRGPARVIGLRLHASY